MADTEMGEINLEYDGLFRGGPSWYPEREDRRFRHLTFQPQHGTLKLNGGLLQFNCVIYKIEYEGTGYDLEQLYKFSIVRDYDGGLVEFTETLNYVKDNFKVDDYEPDITDDDFKLLLLDCYKDAIMLSSSSLGNKEIVGNFISYMYDTTSINSSANISNAYAQSQEIYFLKKNVFLCKPQIVFEILFPGLTNTCFNMFMCLFIAGFTDKRLFTFLKELSHSFIRQAVNESVVIQELYIMYDSVKSNLQLNYTVDSIPGISKMQVIAQMIRDFSNTSGGKPNYLTFTIDEIDHTIENNVLHPRKFSGIIEVKHEVTSFNFSGIRAEITPPQAQGQRTIELDIHGKYRGLVGASHAGNVDRTTMWQDLDTLINYLRTKIKDDKLIELVLRRSPYYRSAIMVILAGKSLLDTLRALSFKDFIQQRKAMQYGGFNFIIGNDINSTLSSTEKIDDCCNIYVQSGTQNIVSQLLVGMKIDTLNLLGISFDRYTAKYDEKPTLFGTIKKDKNKLFYLNKDIFYLKSL